jgi:hypothetical protein
MLSLAWLSGLRTINSHPLCFVYSVFQLWLLLSLNSWSTRIPGPSLRLFQFHLLLLLPLQPSPSAMLCPTSLPPQSLPLTSLGHSDCPLLKQMSLLCHTSVFPQQTVRSQRGCTLQFSFTVSLELFHYILFFIFSFLMPELKVKLDLMISSIKICLNYKNSMNQA